MSRSGRILLVDDDSARSALADQLAREGYEVEVAAGAVEALDAYETTPPDAVVIDIDRSRGDALQLIKQIRGSAEPAAVIAIADTAGSSTEAAIRAGASESLVHPIQGDVLITALDRVLEGTGVHKRLADTGPEDIVGSSPGMRRVFDVLDQVARSRSAVLITGESGTGKELIAKAIHRRSTRAEMPLVKVHCAGVSETVLDSELFGHERGAVQGALTQRDGRIAHAEGGTLFLDEVSEISPAIQIKLLRLLQDHELERVGGTEVFRVDVRVIAATNHELGQLVSQDKFRADLYYALRAVSLELPPLRERRADIPVLAKHFVDRFARDTGKPAPTLAQPTLEHLMSYDWPGNISELESALEHAVAVCNGTQIDPHNLPSNVHPNKSRSFPAIPGASMAELERYAILETLRAVGGSTSKAAEMLGISVRTIQYRLHEYDMVPRSEVYALRKQNRNNTNH
ncbi:MAG: sigma-54-dependent transcriptional regulator [Kofleriaceae bacterium]